jgi:hypothetical protein
MVAVEQWMDTGRNCRSVFRWADSYTHTYADANSDSNARSGVSE